MYKSHSVYPARSGTRPKKFGRFGFKPRFQNRKRNTKSRGERIDFSRFIKKGIYVEEKPYVAKHNFADFPFNPQLHKNIERVGYKSPRPIQDQAIPSVMDGKDKAVTVGIGGLMEELW
jgi:hypothetical protein